MHTEDAHVIEHLEVLGGYKQLVMESPRIAPEVQPGQFVHLRVPHMEEALLRRPFSIFKAERTRLSILYKAVGRGTETMKHLLPGETVSLVGPLGHGFPLETENRNPILVAGGYGMAALYLVARNLPVPGHAFFGGASEPDILCVPDFIALGWTVHVATEDGSLGTHGLVTHALDPWLERLPEGEDPLLYACGPNQMLRAIGDRAQARNLTAWLSVDRNMGCGVGACLTCVVKIRDGDDWKWARSCKEGPVFESREIIWDE